MSVVNLTARDLARLKGVNPNLVKVVYRAAELYAPKRFTVVEGVRSAARQAELVKSGASTTKNSRHLTGHAVDVAPLVGGTIPWNNWGAFSELAKAMFRASAELGVAIEWGGNWSKFKDGPHYQIPWSVKPQ